MWPFSDRKARRTAPARHRSPACLPQLEVLEDRCLLNAGYLDPTFGAAGAGVLPHGAESVLVQPNSQVLAFSYSTVTRYNADGSLDTSFGSGGTAQANFGAGWTPSGANSEILQPDGKILVSGVVYPPNTTTGLTLGVARFNSDGSPDTTFGGGQGVVTTTFSTMNTRDASQGGVVVQPDGKIVVGGGYTYFVTSNKQTTTYGDFDLARYNPDGSLDTSFGTQGKVVTPLLPNVQAEADALLLQPNGELIEVGDLGNSEPQDWLLARYNTNGNLDASFGSQGIVATPSGQMGSIGYRVSGAALYPSTGTTDDGKIVVVGQNTSVSGPALARYNTDGSLDTTFGSGGFVPLGVSPSGVTFDASGRLVVAGSGSSQMALERLNPDGTADATFGSGGVVTAGLPGTQGGGLAIYPGTGTDTADAGKIVLGGSYVARFLPAAPQAGASFVVSGPSSTTAGVPFTITVTATDANGNVLTGYTGTVDFSSLDGQAVLPAPYTFTAADQGVHTFTVTLKTAGTQAVFVADAATPGMNGREVGLQVNPGPVTHFVWVGNPPTTVKSGTSFNLFAEAVDAFGNEAVCNDTVAFSSSDHKATLPGNETFQNNRNLGVFILRTRGTQTITMTDMNNPSLSITLTITVT